MASKSAQINRLIEKGDICINVPTLNDYNECLIIYEKLGLKWCSGKLATKGVTKYDNWSNYEEETCLCLSQAFGYTGKQWYLEQGYTVISFKEFEQMYYNKLRKINIKKIIGE